MKQNIVELDKSLVKIPTKEDLEKAQRACEIAKRIFEKVKFYRTRRENANK